MDLHNSNFTFLKRTVIFIILLFQLVAVACREALSQALKRLPYNNPGLTVDLAVGLRSWPLPMDYNGNGLTDLVVICSDVPYDGVYLFENTGQLDEENGMPLFSKARRLFDARKYLRPDPKLDRASNVRISYIKGEAIVLTPGNIYPDFKQTGFERPIKLPVSKEFHGYDPFEIRADQWQLTDFDDDGITDLLVGIGYWGEYNGGSYNKQGQWTAGPLHGYVYLLKNCGTDEMPMYAIPQKLKTTDGTLIDVFGWPSPNFTDFNNDGVMDIICGEFRDSFLFYMGVGTSYAPLFAPARPLTYKDKRITLDLCMPTPVAYDFTGDGHPDLIAGDEAGRVLLIEHTGQVVDGMPQFLPPRYFRQEADEVNVGALATPVGFDWNGDGHNDIISGNSAGEIIFIENLNENGQGWAEPVLLKADEKVIRIMAGPNGSIKGPSEAKWGYTTLSVADWNLDGLPDLVVNSIRGQVIWYENVGTHTNPKLSGARPVAVEWKGEVPKPAWNWWEPEGINLVTQWRTTPCAIDWTGDDLTDLIMLDHEGYLALYERQKRGQSLVLVPGKRVFRMEGENKPLRLNPNEAGSSGRRKLAIADFDLDGKPDLLLDGQNAVLYKNIGNENGITIFRDMGLLDDLNLAGHSTSPAAVDITGDEVPELLVGGEDGYIYYRSNPFTHAP